MFTNRHLKRHILLFLSLSIISGQEQDTTLQEESNNSEKYTNIYFAYSKDEGNTDLISSYYGFSHAILGDIGPLKDTEFLIDFNRSDDQLDGEPYTDDQYLTLKFDLWANQKYSPFLFFQKSFDNVIGLEDRLNYGLGGKVTMSEVLSVSYAFLFEKEDYLYYEYTDSTTDGTSANGYYYYDVFWDDVYYIYTDSTETPAEQFYRHSIRPKIKMKLYDNNLVLDYRFYYKPRVDDFNEYLLEHELKISLVTFSEKVTVELNYENKFNSRYEGVRIMNRRAGVPYEAKDTNLSIGLALNF